jgi:hypothetical protein
MRLLGFDIEIGRARNVDHDGFFHGAHNLSADNGKAEITAHFEQRIQTAKQKAVAKKKKLEARLEHLTKSAPAIEHIWQSVEDTIAPEQLQVIMPLLVTLMGLAALLTDIALVAPSLDLLDITDRNTQLVGAFGLAALGSVLLHLAWTTLEDNGQSALWNIIWRILGGLSAVALFLWGILRGYQVAFAAEMNDNALAKFLHGHPILASIFFVFITLGAPLAAAGALTHGSRHLRDWYRYRLAKRNANRLARQLAETKKRLEAEQEGLQHELERLRHEQREWTHAYLRQHERGKRNGAKQSPFWLVHLVSAAVALTTLIVVWWALAFSTFSLLLPALAYLLAFLYFRHRRIHPSPAQFFKLERVTFAAPLVAGEFEHKQLYEHNQLSAVTSSRVKRQGKAVQLETQESD